MAGIFGDVKVLDFTNNLAGPVATLMLATFGAEVIKIERPGKGDDSRGFGLRIDGVSVFYMAHNRGKKSLALDTKKPEAVAILRKLVSKVDVVVESFRPGVIDKMGFGYEELKKINPSIIMCSVSAFGQTGPYSQWPGYDIIAQGVSGIMSVTGAGDGPPTKVGPSIGDYVTGFNAFGAIAAALYYRAKSGKGQYIDTCLVDCLVAANDYADYAFNGFEVKRTGNHHGLFAPYGVYNGNGGNIIIGILNQKLWNTLCVIMNHPEMIDNPKYDDPGKRRQVLPEIIGAIEPWLKSFPDIDEPFRILKEKGIPCTKVYTLPDLLTDPHILSREMVTDMDVPYLSSGKMKTKGIQIKFAENPGVLGSPPQVGEHQKEILNMVGYGDKEIQALKDKGVF
ncbi:MAG: CaiB/BaiF CoA transferase family protein [Syntrophales bacterium]